MKKLFRKLFPNKQQDSLRVQLVQSHKLRLDQWRKDESLVTQMKSLEHNQTFIMAIQCLQNEHPRHIVMSPMGVNPNDRIVHQAKIEGYEICLNALSSLSTPYKTVSPVESTFAKPE
jgi:hypothetical protein